MRDGHKVFISYSKKDDSNSQAIVDKIRDLLAESGIECWRDIDSISPGRDWQASIQNVIDKSSAVLCFITPEYQNSHWCQAEMNFALLDKKPVIPILLKDAPKTGVLSLLHYLDLRGMKPGDGDSIRKSYETLEAAVKKLSESPETIKKIQSDTN